jgi:Polysaccharide pyruvyl transferase
MNQRNGLKIGVLTFHRCINYGSYWQARCLVEGLKLRGHNATILDHSSRRINIAEWKCAFQPVLPHPIPESDHVLYREKIERFFQAFETLPLSASFPLHQPDEMEEYDVAVVGSDEVWNLCHPWYGKCPLFYGEGIKAQRLISYAASFGNYPATIGLGPEWANRLYNFDTIAVRDENSKQLIASVMDEEPEMVLDPCLQFVMNIHAQQPVHISQQYLAVYGHNFSASFIAEVRRWARKQKLPLISIGYRNDWADEQWITAGPHEFAQFMKGAQAVATNFFHGCVFALRNEKPFVCETSDYRSLKVEGLMRKVGGENHLVTGATPSDLYDYLLQAPLRSSILQTIHNLRQQSDEYLDRALNVKQRQVA